MINVFYVPGTFGSTVEYILHHFTDKFGCLPVDLQNDIASDGSMHTFNKTFHPRSLQEIKNFFSADHDHSIITTPVFPCHDGKFVEIFNEFQKHSQPGDKNIVLYTPTFADAELNILFRHYKIFTGKVNFGVDVFLATSDNVNEWDPSYTHWNQMKKWEFREWISLYYRPRISDTFAPLEFDHEPLLKLSNKQILDSPGQAFREILDFCGLTLTHEEKFNEFIEVWRQAQQYIVDEYHYMQDYIEHSIKGVDFVWPLSYPMNVFTEAIIQTRLRDQGFSIKCFNLDQLPKNSSDLHSLLESI